MKVEWIAVDWGTSTLRTWAMSAEGQVLDNRSSEQGMGKIERNQYESILLDLCDSWLDSDRSVPVIVCGMAGARQGWKEAPYLSTPIELSHPLSLVDVGTGDQRINVSIVPGIKQYQPADVMRGEEMQIRGFLSINPDFTGIIAMPGTHTKWVKLVRGNLTEFSTVMTGELFDVLSSHSLLRYSTEGGQFSQSDFNDMFIEAINSPHEIVERLFRMRAEQLLNQQASDTACSQLSANLIALEVTAVKERFPPLQNHEIAIIGNKKLSSLYRQALKMCHCNTSVHSGDQMVVSGLYYTFKQRNTAKQGREER